VEAVQIRPRVAGVIDEVRFTEGHEVEPGDVLFVIDQRPYRAELARAEAELEAARAQVAPARSEAARARTLFEKRNISQEVLDQRVAAEAQVAAGVRAAQAAVDIARLNLEFTEVRSPIAGRTGRALVTKGNLVDAGNTLLTNVVSLDPVYVYFETDEQVFLRSTDSQRRGARHPVQVALSNEEGFPHSGVMDFVDNQLNPDTGTITSRAVLDNRDRIFTPGLFARVRVQGGEKQRTVLIDDKSILTDQDRKFVYVLGSDNTAQRRDVKPGRAIDGLRIITEGLMDNDRIIVHGVQKVFFPGMPVDPQLIEMGQPPSVVGATRPTADDAPLTEDDQVEAPST
jgi:multidrug efflux system membrane fusion protein